MKLRNLESWLTPTDAARLLTEDGNGISRQAIEKRLNEGKHRAVKTRQGWLIDPDRIVDWLEREKALREAEE